MAFPFDMSLLATCDPFFFLWEANFEKEGNESLGWKIHGLSLRMLQMGHDCGDTDSRLIRQEVLGLCICQSGYSSGYRGRLER